MFLNRVSDELLAGRTCLGQFNELCTSFDNWLLNETQASARISYCIVHARASTRTRAFTHETNGYSFIDCQNKSSGSANWTTRSQSTWDQVSIRLSSIRGRQPRKWTPRLCNGLPYFCRLFMLGPTDDTPPTDKHPTSQQIWPFPLKRGKPFTPSSMFRCPSFSPLFRRRALKFQLIRRKGRRTRRIFP